MLIKLAILFFNACGREHPRDLESSPLTSKNEPLVDEADSVNIKTFEGKIWMHTVLQNESVKLAIYDIVVWFIDVKDETSWSTWLWNMVPTILPQETDNVLQNKEINPTFHVSFCVKNLGLDLKVIVNYYYFLKIILH